MRMWFTANTLRDTEASNILSESPASLDHRRDFVLEMMHEPRDEVDNKFLEA